MQEEQTLSYVGPEDDGDENGDRKEKSGQEHDEANDEPPFRGGNAMHGS